MKSIYKYLAHAGLTAALCIFMAVPSMAQRGGHSGGGGGGGHFSGGGGGGGFHGSTGFSGARSTGSVSRGSFNPGSRGSFNPGSRGSFNAGSRGSIGARAGAVHTSAAPRGYIRSVGAPGSRMLGNRSAVTGHSGVNAVYGHSYAGHGEYARPYGWHTHGGYFYSHGYYGSLYYPWLGLGYDFLPYGYYPFWWNDAYYYYSGGLFYQYDNDQYTVVEPPIGAEVKSLPDKAQSIVIDGQQYYELNGVYYQPITKDDGTVTYQVAGKDGELNTGAQGAASVTPKVGDMTNTLPPGCKKVKLNGQTLYVSDDGIYYQETKDASGNKAYKIVALENNNTDGQ